LLPAAAVVVFWVMLWLGRNKAWSRSVFFAFTYFLISLFPVMGFFNIYFFRFSFVGDHFQYLASMGIIALVAASLSSLPKLTQLPSTVLLLTFLVLAWKQTTIYRNQETLWRDTLAKNPAAWMAHDNLGVALASQGRLPEAIQNYEQAVQLNPDYAEAYNDLGVALASQGRLPEAIEKYEQAFRIKPDYVKAYYNLGNALTRRGELAEAIQNYERAIQLEPDYADAYANLGTVLARQGKWPESIQHFERALQLKPEYPNAYYNLGLVLAAQGKLTEAIQSYERAVQLNPDYAEAYNNLGVVLSSQGKLTDAIRNYERAIQLKPNYVDALNNLAYALATSQNALLRNGVRAIELSERANQLTGGSNPVFLGTLAAAYAEARRYPEAVETISRAIEQAGVQGNFALVSDFESQLRLYKAHAAGDAQ
jgi:tetratricopeptide (TPR) repeat protein